MRLIALAGPSCTQLAMRTRFTALLLGLGHFPRKLRQFEVSPMLENGSQLQAA